MFNAPASSWFEFWGHRSAPEHPLKSCRVSATLPSNPDRLTDPVTILDNFPRCGRHSNNHRCEMSPCDMFPVCPPPRSPAPAGYSSGGSPTPSLPGGRPTSPSPPSAEPAQSGGREGLTQNYLSSPRKIVRKLEDDEFSDSDIATMMAEYFGVNLETVENLHYLILHLSVRGVQMVKQLNLTRHHGLCGWNKVKYA